MPWIPLAVAGVSAVGGLIQQNSANKAAKAAAEAAKIDVNAVDAKTREIARKNAFDSAELERQLTPEVPELRQKANLGVLGSMGQSESERAALAKLQGSLGQPVGQQLQSSLLQAAIAKAKADLDMGGKLDPDTQNLVTRTALAHAGGVGGGGLGLGRDITARDLGLTSIGLQNQRLQNASQLGQQDIGVQQGNNEYAFNNASHLMNQIQLLRAINDGTFSRNLAAAQYGQSIAPPTVGLSPGSVADLYTGNASNASAAAANAANIKGAQGNAMLGFAGQALGYGLQNYTSTPARTTPTTNFLNTTNVGQNYSNGFRYA